MYTYFYYPKVLELEIERFWRIRLKTSISPHFAVVIGMITYEATTSVKWSVIAVVKILVLIEVEGL